MPLPGDIWEQKSTLILKSPRISSNWETNFERCSCVVFIMAILVFNTRRFMLSRAFSLSACITINSLGEERVYLSDFRVYICSLYMFIVYAYGCVFFLFLTVSGVGSDYRDQTWFSMH